ncbi:hypothetical protein SAMN06265795_11450 [Noviherbaspirillum humi]|uniref:Pirin n=1 Tax=Noviherbaspirillum humi TaxID=1688639 RepID=A0A239K056_9BURK|nr:pirin family protein [Noviherbaspirillum humi]SNT11043.1 hypothetical protein SAMN06265795_11450 [Noviherbaspirillum humi]
MPPAIPDTGPGFDLIKPHVKDIGGFTVKRLLPAHPHQMVGPFIFFDHMGPAEFSPGQGMDVRPHPHIGLATVTYLFDGAIMHRDSLGTRQAIRPGDVNWMTAGSGIAHSERTPPDLRERGGTLHGIQTWVALPVSDEEAEPAFEHHPAATLPVIKFPGVTLRLIVGNAFGQSAPARTYSPIFYLAGDMEGGSRFKLPAEHEERAVYLVEGDLSLDGQPLEAHRMAVLKPGGEIELSSQDGARLMLLGGAKMEGERFIWWNFVASSRDAIAAAKEKWRQQAFGQVPDESEWIPLPPEPKPAESFS